MEPTITDIIQTYWPHMTVGAGVLITIGGNLVRLEQINKKVEKTEDEFATKKELKKVGDELNAHCEQLKKALFAEDNTPTFVKVSDCRLCRGDFSEQIKDVVSAINGTMEKETGRIVEALNRSTKMLIQTNAEVRALGAIQKDHGEQLGVIHERLHDMARKGGG